MPNYWMISNRNVKKDGLGSDRSELTYWMADDDRVDSFPVWNRCRWSSFKNELVRVADRFPSLTDARGQENQKHVTLFVHGYDTGWEDAARRYLQICRAMYGGTDGLGICVLFTWPSDGRTFDYLPDRIGAERSSHDLADVLGELYDWLLDRQVAAARDAEQACKAKTSLIAHSMGNYVLQRAMQFAWTRKNQPLLVSLVNQLLMVAADVDNDLFKSGEVVTKSDGDAIANLTYRVTALYTGRDSTLGLSAGLKHFGKRRLGRSGLDRTMPVPDNVWDVDCSGLFKPDESDIHSAYFESPSTIDLMKRILRGIDRRVIAAEAGARPAGAAP